MARRPKAAPTGRPPGLDRRVRIVPKVWGEERWIVNGDLYCGKQMLLRRGFRCSMHMHRVKDETFFVTAGSMLFEIEGPTGRIRRRVLGPGAVQHVPPGTWHRFTGIVDTEFFEFSTTHADEDSYRREESGPAPAAVMRSLGRRGETADGDRGRARGPGAGRGERGGPSRAAGDGRRGPRAS